MRPLEGITVVALEHAIAAPFCTRQLADLGAKVGQRLGGGRAGEGLARLKHLHPGERGGWRRWEVRGTQSFWRVHQNERGNPSTCSATYERMRLVEIGATW